jgi:DNA repair protein RadC
MKGRRQKPPNRLIREQRTDERPRERLQAHGVGTLSDSELLAIVLRTGRPGASAVDLARELLEDCGGLAGLVEESGHPLERSGLGPAKRAAVRAAVEIGRRLAEARTPKRYRLDRPEAVARYLGLRFVVDGQEVMGALCLDTRNRLLEAREVFRGTLDRAAVEPRALLKLALERSAAGIILFHTHPSGDPSPSVEDLAFTRRVGTACDALGLRLVDHIILGHGGRWLSLRQRGGW